MLWSWQQCSYSVYKCHWLAIMVYTAIDSESVSIQLYFHMCSVTPFQYSSYLLLFGEALVRSFDIHYEEKAVAV